KKINKVGKLLSSGDFYSEDFQEAIELANRWRACHAYPINTFQATLRKKMKDVSKEGLVAQRLKRMPTIIDKLHRFPNMQLTTMQDIAGIRGILNKVSEVKKLVKLYIDNRSFPHELVEAYDYIENPRD